MRIYIPYCLLFPIPLSELPAKYQSTPNGRYAFRISPCKRQYFRFAVNLQCGCSANPRDDIALHLSPRFDGNLSRVVRNSLQQQNWGSEESIGHFPFALGKPFEILILVQLDHFKIAINGEHYTEFRYRMPLQKITAIAIDGDVILNSVRCEGAVIFLITFLWLIPYV
ncbi:unnamed protein product [Soboliphyme baturini]|uniref:Galectin n=1 Tax=Soboliphyme baturini TaxID=241478 RepID=A0A183J8T7_9BILA|nr:unnamed protein product [Soboliphyme baturini]